jgi:V/A-type H+-transporting ATPase subunit K
VNNRYGLALALLVTSPLWSLSVAMAQEAAGVTPIAGGESAFRTVGLALAAAISLSVSVLGSSYAVARIGSAALGAAAEKPELLTRSILFVALAEGLAVLGFAMAMVLVRKI